jgi:hypothetical protein
LKFILYEFIHPLSFLKKLQTTQNQHNEHMSNFCKFAGIIKQKISAYHIFLKYRLITIYSGTNFSSFLDFRLIQQVKTFNRTEQQIFGAESLW